MELPHHNRDILRSAFWTSPLVHGVATILDHEGPDLVLKVDLLGFSLGGMIGHMTCLHVLIACVVLVMPDMQF